MISARSVTRAQKSSDGDGRPEYGRKIVESQVRNASWQVFRVEALAADQIA